MFPGPVEGVTVTLNGFDPDQTDEDGQIVFVFNEEPTGTYSYQFEKEGFITATGEIEASEIILGEETWVGVGLLPEISSGNSIVESTPDPLTASVEQEFSFTVELKGTILDGDEYNPVLRNYPFYDWNFQAELSGEPRDTGNATGEISLENIEMDGLVYTVTLTYSVSEDIHIYVQVDGVWLDDTVTVNVTDL